MRALPWSALGFAAALCLRPAVAQQEGCSLDTLRVDDVPVTVTLCAGAASEPRRRQEGQALTVSVTETFAAGSASFSRTVALEFMAGKEASRTIDDVPLQKLGIERTVHLTIGYRTGALRLEHAMALPGAVTLK